MKKSFFLFLLISFFFFNCTKQDLELRTSQYKISDLIGNWQNTVNNGVLNDSTSLSDSLLPKDVFYTFNFDNTFSIENGYLPFEQIPTSYGKWELNNDTILFLPEYETDVDSLVFSNYQYLWLIMDLRNDTLNVNFIKKIKNSNNDEIDFHRQFVKYD